MKFIKKLETKQNKNTEFCKADYYVLDYNQLLEVNGAKGESGGGGPSGPSSSPSSSSPSNTSSSSSSSSSGSGKGGSSGGQSAPSSSTTNDTSTNIPTDTTSSSPAVTNDGYIENSNYGVANAKPGDQLKRDDGTIVTITQGDINWAKEQLAKESANSNNTPSNPSSPTNNPSNTTPSAEKGQDSTSSNTIESITEKTSGSWGEITNEIVVNSTMQEHKDDGLDKMNGTDKQGNSNKLSKSGCKMEGASKIITEVSGKDVDIVKINKDYDSNNDGFLNQEEITTAIQKELPEGKTVIADNWEKQLSKEKLDEIADHQNGTTYILGRAEDVHGGQHWIVLEGYSINANGQVEFDYNGTSVFDALNNRKYILGEPTAVQKANNYHQISRIETYTII